MPWTKILIEKQEPGFDEHVGQDVRKLTFPQALREATDQALEQDGRVFVMGQGVDDPMGMFGTTLDLHKKYGGERVFDTPLSENGLMGVAVGAAIAGASCCWRWTRLSITPPSGAICSGERSNVPS